MAKATDIPQWAQDYDGDWGELIAHLDTIRDDAGLADHLFASKQEAFEIGAAIGSKSREIEPDGVPHGRTKPDTNADLSEVPTIDPRTAIAEVRWVTDGGDDCLGEASLGWATTLGSEPHTDDRGVRAQFPELDDEEWADLREEALNRTDMAKAELLLKAIDPSVCWAVWDIIERSYRANDPSYKAPPRLRSS